MILKSIGNARFFLRNNSIRIMSNKKQLLFQKKTFYYFLHIDKEIIRFHLF